MSTSESQSAGPVHPSAQIPYSYPQPVYAVIAPQPKGLSITSMVLGLVSIVFGFTFVLPTIGLILGILGHRREPAGRGMALTGIIISSVILLTWVTIVVFLLISVFGIAAVGATSHLTN